MAVIQRVPGDVLSFNVASGVTAISYTVDSNGVKTYSSGGLRQGSLVKIDASGAGYHDIVQATTGDQVLGVVLDYPAAAPSMPCQVQVKGVARVRTHGAITINTSVYCGDSSGRIDETPSGAATTQYTVGIALETGVEADDLIEVLLLPGSTNVATS